MWIRFLIDATQQLKTAFAGLRTNRHHFGCVQSRQPLGTESCLEKLSCVDHGLATAEGEGSDIAAAINAYTKAIQRHPNHPECHQNLAVALLMGGDIDGARNGFRIALDLLEAQGRNNEAKALRSQVEGLVKLNEAGR